MFAGGTSLEHVYSDEDRSQSRQSGGYISGHTRKKELDAAAKGKLGVLVNVYKPKQGKRK